MSKDTKKYHLLKDMINWSTGHVIPKGEEFIQLQGTRKYQSLNGWQMSESACLNKEWFKEVLPEQPKQQEERIEINGNRVHYELGENGVPNIISIKGYLFYPATNAQKTYTQSEVDTIREETFRDGYFKGWYNGCFEKDKTISNKVTDKAFEEYNNNAKNKPTPTPQGSKEGWEILSVLDDDGKPIYYPSDDIRQMVSKNKGERIHSVRRNSDMTVFTVGDIMSYGTAGVGTPLFSTENQLLSFNIREDGMIYGEVGDKIFFPITHLHKAKSPSQPQQGKPLFTTEDGRGIRSEYDIVLYHVSPNYDLSWSGSRYLLKQNRDGFKFFFTKEAAEQYILENKPFLSFKEVKELWDKHYFGHELISEFTENLINFIKQTKQ